MPWREQSIMSQREEFVRLVEAGGVSKAELCRRFGISRPTGDKWLQRWRGGIGLADQSRRPHHSPGATASRIQEAVLQVRQEHPAWGPRKIAAVLGRRGVRAPACSTIGAILKRRGLIDSAESSKHRAWERFEHAQANDLWQMDFMGHFALGCGQRCHVMGVLDDHSRYALGVHACGDQREATVREQLERIFRSYGMPRRILADNGPPWGAPHEWRPYTALEVWLLDQGVRMTHGRPHHPQTQGKQERFHRTLRAEVIRRRDLEDLREAQTVLGAWRECYNQERPHEALGMMPPASRYRVSARAFDAKAGPLEPGPDQSCRRVHTGGHMVWRNRKVMISGGLSGRLVGVRERSLGVLEVHYGPYLVGLVDLDREPARLSRWRAPLAEPRSDATATGGLKV